MSLEARDWTQHRWKDLVRATFNEEIEAFNTPNTKNVRRLSKRYLGREWISASAMEHGTELVTLDRDFTHVPQILVALYEQ